MENGKAQPMASSSTGKTKSKNIMIWTPSKYLHQISYAHSFKMLSTQSLSDNNQTTSGAIQDAYR